MIELASIVNIARKNVGNFRGSVVYPESPVCGFVCDEVLDILERQNELEKVMFEFSQTLHYVLHNKTINKIYDVQFKQFIHPKLRAKLPDILIIDLNQLGKVEAKLTSIGMYEEIATEYSSRLFRLTNNK